MIITKSGIRYIIENRYIIQGNKVAVSATSNPIVNRHQIPLFKCIRPITITFNELFNP